MAEASETAARFGHDVVLLDAEATRAEVNSPLYLGGLIDRTGTGTLDPARLSWGLGRVEPRGPNPWSTQVVRLARRGAGVRLETEQGAIDARHALLASGASRGLVYGGPEANRPRLRLRPGHGAPHPRQLASIGWANRQGSPMRPTSFTTTG